jgi:hypothetical protein
VKKLLTILFILGSLFANSQCSSHNRVTLTLTDFTAKEAYYPNGISTLHPGDTLVIPQLAGGAVYSNIELDTIMGTAGCPITIINSGGIVPITQMRLGASGARTKTCSYFKITGTGVPGITYGFHFGVLQTGVASHYQVDSVEASGHDNGLFFHINPDTSVKRTVYPNFVNDSVHIYRCYIHNTNGEGFYIGHTYPSGDPYSGGFVPIRMRRVEIDHNICDSTGWDGIQLSNAQDGCSIHDNIVTHFGRADAGAQRAGIIGGANSKVRIFNNTVQLGTGNGIQGFGYDTLEVDHNTIDHVGNTLDDGCSGCLGEQSIFIKAQLNIETRAKQYVYVHDNNIISPRTKGIIQTNNDANYSDSAKFINNTICFTGSVPSNWLTAYISLSQAGKVVSGNTATVCSGAPSANAGSDQSITLPVSTVTLNGSATPGAGHTIVGYNWSNISGPNSPTIVSPSSASTVINGLIQGTYVFRLNVAQDDEQFAIDDVIITVLPAGPTPQSLRLKGLKNFRVK